MKTNILAVIAIVAMTSASQAFIQEIKAPKMKCVVTTSNPEGSKQKTYETEFQADGRGQIELGEVASGVKASAFYNPAMPNPFAISAQDSEKFISTTGILFVYLGLAGNRTEDPNVDIQCSLTPIR